MPTGESYVLEVIRVTERANAMKTLSMARQLQEERQKLVDEGKARWVKVPILNGYKLIFELIK
jgi:hypothetical protein